MKCPCCSGKTYEDCCKPFHQGALPATAQQLMRSRYSAYALNLPDYIMATTHPLNRNYNKNSVEWRASLTQFSLNTTFQRLEVLDFKEKKNHATVKFTAFLSQQGHDATFTEESTFEKVDGHWLYKSGRISS